MNKNNDPLKNEILETQIFHLLDQDKLIWTPGISGEFSLKSAYESEETKSLMEQIGLGQAGAAKTLLYTLPTLLRELPTQDRLVRRKVLSQSSCAFCNASREYTLHLFFDCPYSRYIWTAVKSLLGLNHQYTDSKAEWIKGDQCV